MRDHPSQHVSNPLDDEAKGREHKAARKYYVIQEAGMGEQDARAGDKVAEPTGEDE